MTAETTVLVPSTTIVEQGIVSDDRGRIHEKAVGDIVEMIRAKYVEEGARNFAIGKRAFEHAQWQKGNFPGYTGGDFDTLMRRIRDDVRMYVPISADSIRVDDWARCHVMRELVRESDGEAIAQSLSMHEYHILIGKALSFDKKAVEGSLVAGWIDFVRSVATDRDNGKRVSANDYRDRIKATEERLAAAKVSANPVEAAAREAAAGITKKADDSAKAVTAVTKSVSDALAAGNLKTDGVVGIVEQVAKSLKLPMPPAFGFDPSTCTIEDCDLLASALFAAGKLTEMRHLVNRLSKMVSAVEKAREAAIAHGTSTIEQGKASREQGKAETRRSKASAPAELAAA
jgi:hypothetical protein